MNRDKFVRTLRKFARQNGLFFEVKEWRGKGGHWIVTVGERWTTVQSDFDEFDARRCLKQLEIDPAAL